MRIRSGDMFHLRELGFQTDVLHHMFYLYEKDMKVEIPWSLLMLTTGKSQKIINELISKLKSFNQIVKEMAEATIDLDVEEYFEITEEEKI